MSKPLALVIEDNEMLATFFATTLQDAGYEAETAHTAGRALAYLEEQTPTIIIVDLQLPDISGEEVLSHIRGQARFQATTIFATSIDGTRVGYLQDQVDLVLTKPVSYQQLLKLTQRLHTATES
jgi:DNA-binding response OmpR family regulator